MPRLRSRASAASLASLGSVGFAVLAALAALSALGACGLDVGGTIPATSAEASTDSATGADGDPALDADPGSDGATEGSANDARADGDAASGFDVTPLPDAAPPGAFVFAHSATDLYKIDVGKGSFTSVKLGACAGLLQDIGVTAAGSVDGNSATQIFHVDVASGACSLGVAGVFASTLSYAPAGTVQPVETLVAIDQSDYVRYDALGQKTIVKHNALPNGYSPSGDIACNATSCFVSVVGNNCLDCLLEIDPGTGVFVKNWGDIGKAKVFGLACVGPKVYGFTNGGDVLAMTFSGTTMTVTAITGLPITPFVGAGAAP